MAKQTKLNDRTKVIEVGAERLEELLAHTANSLSTEDHELIVAIAESYEYVCDLVDGKNMSISRLRKLIFGSPSERYKDIVGDTPTESNGGPGDDELKPEGSADAPTDTQEPSSEDKKTKEPVPGHGRNGADAYTSAEQINVDHDCLQPGDSCPECESGTLYEKPPGVRVRIVGRPPLQATIYRLQKLRCNLCGKVFTASAPDEVGTQKYDATAASMIALLKYGSGLPFNRLERLQGNLGVPLPASTQWDVLAASADQFVPAYEELIRQAAQGDVLYNDDTTVKILELMGDYEQTETEQEQFGKRTGIFTTGIVSTCEGRRIALFFSGRQHAGENLGDVLKQRVEELAAPIQMSDALSRNCPKELEVIVSNCLTHARRQFVELHDLFTTECEHVLEAMTVIYKNDATARDQGLSPEQRLEFHQRHSKSTMDDLKVWFERQFAERLIEPNSSLGEAITYMLKRWSAFTLFLRKAGAPLDNNICERALKKAIVHRKNSLFYKTRNGARVGDMFMSLIYTCELSKINPFDYLTELQRNTDTAVEHPECWMPWNFLETLEALSSQAEASAVPV